MVDYSKISLLIIDDEDDIRDIIKDEFAETGMMIYEANCGQDALGLIDTFPPDKGIDVIISDFRMPKGDGLSVYNGLKLRGKNPLFFLCTGYSDVSKDQSVKMGINGYIRKPFGPQEILNSVKEMLEKKAS